MLARAVPVAGRPCLPKAVQLPIGVWLWSLWPCLAQPASQACCPECDATLGVMHAAKKVPSPTSYNQGNDGVGYPTVKSTGGDDPWLSHQCLRLWLDTSNPVKSATSNRGHFWSSGRLDSFLMRFGFIGCTTVTPPPSMPWGPVA